MRPGRRSPTVMDDVSSREPPELPPFAPIPASTGAIRELGRLEWWLTPGADPVAVLGDFLRGYDLGMPRRDQTVTQGNGDRIVTGAVLLISAAAANVIAGVSPGPSTPTPAVPDIFSVVYELPHDHPTIAAVSGGLSRPGRRRWRGRRG